LTRDFTASALGSSGASFRNCSYAEMADGRSFAFSAAWASWIWMLASVGWSSASWTYLSFAAWYACVVRV